MPKNDFPEGLLNTANFKSDKSQTQSSLLPWFTSTTKMEFKINKQIKIKDFNLKKNIKVPLLCIPIVRKLIYKNWSRDKILEHSSTGNTYTPKLRQKSENHFQFNKI